MAVALDVAEAGMAAGELPIGAVVVMGDDVVGSACTRDRGLDRRTAHADLLAMVEADERLGWRSRPAPLTLAVTLEPCVMCLGTAMVLGVSHVHYGLASPGDGGSGVAAAWRPHPTTPWFAAPAMTGGVCEDRVRDQFRRYVATAEESGAVAWARSLIQHRSRTR